MSALDETRDDAIRRGVSAYVMANNSRAFTAPVLTTTANTTAKATTKSTTTKTANTTAAGTGWGSNYNGHHPHQEQPSEL